LMGIVPAAGHIVHMPGHIWLAAGDYEMAAEVNVRAAEVDRQYFAASNVTAGSYGMYYAHNLHFITYARAMQGRREDSLRAAADLAGVVAPLVQAMPEMADAFAGVPLFSRVRFAEWDTIVQLPDPGARMPITTAIWRYARVLAAAGKKDAAGVKREMAAFDGARAKVPPDAQWSVNKAGPVMALAAEVLAARTAASEAEALPHWERAVAMQDALTYDEPPAWYYPIRESLGASLLRAGKAAEAEQVAREGLRRSPRDARMLFVLVESLRAQSKTDAAAQVRKELDAAWAKADVKLSLADL
jgi:hypothetical protein